MSHPPDAHFEAWACAALEPLARHELEAHVAACEPCAERLMRAARLSELSRQALVPAAGPSPAAARGRWAVVAATAVMLGAALFFFLPRAPEPTSPPQVPPRSTAAGLQSLGRTIRYEELPDPAWLPDEAS